MNRPPVGTQKGVQCQKIGWHLWATVGKWVTTEIRSGATKRSLDCRMTIAHCNRRFLSIKFCSSLCRCFLHYYADWLLFLLCELRIFLLHLLGLPGNLRWGVFYFNALPPVHVFWAKFIMNFTFGSLVVALTGLFGLAFTLYGVLHSRRGGGKPS